MITVVTELLHNLILGLLIGIFLAIITYKKNLITRKGAITSIFISSLIFLSGWKNFLILFMFFVASTALTLLGYDTKKKKNVAESSHGREWTQVIGTGGMTILWSLINIYSLYIRSHTLYLASLLSLITSIAISNADTWAAEIGTLSNQKPRLIYKPWKTIDTGLSGGVTLLGEIASFGGSLFISIISYFLYLNIIIPEYLLILVLGGWSGEITDSLIGGLLQVKYYCKKCNKVTEKEIHSCGMPTSYYRGLKWIKNETTNFLSSLMISTIIFFITLLIQKPI